MWSNNGLACFTLAKMCSKGEERIFQPILEISYADMQPAIWETAPELQFPGIEFTVEVSINILCD